MTNLNTLPGFSTGGGGGSSNPTIFSSTVATDTLDLGSSRTTYSYTSGAFPASTGTTNIKDRNVFCKWMQWMDSTNGTSGFSVYTFSVNKSTGAITKLQGGVQDAWVNNGAAALSTTYLLHDPNYGCFFSGGNNGYPGYSSHYQGYTAGQIDTSGALVNNSAYVNNGDHGYNGTYCACLTQGSTNYFVTGGYQSSYASHRVITCTSNGITIGNATSNSSWTSSSGAFWHVNQPDQQTVATNEPVSVHGTSFNNPYYGWNVIRSGASSASQVNVSNGYQAALVVKGHSSTGKSLVAQSNDVFATVDSGSNTITSIKDNYRDLDQQLAESYECNLHGLGDNRFLYTGTGNDLGEYDLFKLDSNNNPEQIQRFITGSTTPSILDNPQIGATHFLVYENNTDADPKFLVEVSNNGYPIFDVRVKEFGVNLSTY